MRNEKPKFNITHTFADGTTVDSVKGLVIPRTPETEAVYRLAEEKVAEYLKERES